MDVNDDDSSVAGKGTVYHLDPVGGDPLIAGAFADPFAPDDALVRAAAAGSRQAYSLLVRRYELACLNWALHVAGSMPAATEITLETFRRAWMRMPGATGDFGNWLRAVAAEVAHDSGAATTNVADAEALWLGGLVRDALGHLDPGEATLLLDPSQARDHTSRAKLLAAMGRLQSLLAARGIGRGLR